jgi:hypothetical protein
MTLRRGPSTGLTPTPRLTVEVESFKIDFFLLNPESSDLAGSYRRGDSRSSRSLSWLASAVSELFEFQKSRKSVKNSPKIRFEFIDTEIGSKADSDASKFWLKFGRVPEIRRFEVFGVYLKPVSEYHFRYFENSPKISRSSFRHQSWWECSSRRGLLMVANVSL